MNYLFAKGGMKILESLTFTDTLYAFDFDGTLAPIVREPDSARMPTGVERLFLKLSRRVPTAVISGRSLSDLRRRIPAGCPAQLIGNHGLEGGPSARRRIDSRKLCSAWKQQLYAGLMLEADDPGLELEDKGLSLALHYRKSRKKKLTRGLIARAVEALHPPPRVVGGKLVVNLVPKDGPHKGLALQRLLESRGTPFAFYIGDDVTDEDVFTLPEARIMTVRVGQRNGSAAQYFLKRQGEVEGLLSALLRFHGIPPD
jgi:trehalose 6-phosphate phosphatase